MAPLQELEIIRFDARGEILRRVKGLAGRVTVLRSNDARLMEAYRGALRGIAQEARFSILIDGKTFQPAEHSLVGFEGRPSAFVGNSIRNHLIAAGVGSSEIEQLLVDHGLGGLSAAACEELSVQQQRVVALLAATVDPTKVVVLENPFSELPEQWREKLAERFIKFVKDHRAIVMVTRLDERPKAWIENEYVARIQIERPRQATVGFGGQDQTTAELVDSVRAEYKALSAVVQQPDVVEIERSREKSRILPQFGVLPKQVSVSPILLGVGFLLFAGLVLFVLGSMVGRPIGSESFVAAMRLGAQNAEERTGGMVSSEAASSEPQQGVPPQKTKVSVLDTYPASVKEAVLLAFESPESALRDTSAMGSVAAAPPKVLQQESIDFSRNNQNPEAEAAPPLMMGGVFGEPQLDEQALEQRREEIRRRFLEAIEQQRLSE